MSLIHTCTGQSPENTCTIPVPHQRQLTLTSVCDRTCCYRATEKCNVRIGINLTQIAQTYNRHVTLKCTHQRAHKQSTAKVERTSHVHIRCLKLSILSFTFTVATGNIAVPCRRLSEGNAFSLLLLEPLFLSEVPLSWSRVTHSCHL